MVHDFELLEWIGANSFRTSHYPYAEAVLDYADRHGIVVIDETAAVGLNIGLARRHLRRRGVRDLQRGDDQRRDARGPRQAIRELVARDKNHPSVVMWSIANEPERRRRRRARYFEPLVAETRRARSDPPRRLRQLHARARPDEIGSRDLFDVLMLNRYYGWYVTPAT